MLEFFGLILTLGCPNFGVCEKSEPCARTPAAIGFDLVVFAGGCDPDSDLTCDPRNFLHQWVHLRLRRTARSVRKADLLRAQKM